MISKIFAHLRTIRHTYVWKLVSLWFAFQDKLNMNEVNMITGKNIYMLYSGRSALKLVKLYCHNVAMQIYARFILLSEPQELYYR